jgi:hypothetical protein
MSAGIIKQGIEGLCRGSNDGMAEAQAEDRLDDRLEAIKAGRL